MLLDILKDKKIPNKKEENILINEIILRLKKTSFLIFLFKNILNKIPNELPNIK